MLSFDTSKPPYSLAATANSRQVPFIYTLHVRRQVELVFILRNLPPTQISLYLYSFIYF